MSDQSRIDGPLTNPERDLRHTVEQEQLKAAADLAAAEARRPGEWFDIFMHIVRTSIRQTIELSARVSNVDPSAVEAEMNRILAPQRPFQDHVRARFESHGLPITEEVEFEGPVVSHDAVGSPHIVEWPRGVWIEFHWPSGGKSENLRFEGQSAITALAFILWWSGFNSQAMHMAGKERAVKSRIIAPGTPEYISYMTAKAESRARGEHVAPDPRPEPKRVWPPGSK